jgi:histidinol-phosphate/aromatic aminotransferase/cobyric acid decarboxylase-like protein
MPVTEIGQVFSLNKNLFLQVDDEIKMFSNKNLNDSDRLFELIKEDLLAKKKTNFIFVKDVTTYQRKQLYNLLESKGINRRMLFKHYSY